MAESASDRWRRYRAATDGESLPCALVDLEAFEENVRALVARLTGSGKTMRLATKSVRCPELVQRAMELAGPIARGLMTYCAAETAFWADRGARDLLLAYPVARRQDAELVARTNARGATAAVVVDCPEHLELLASAARAAQTRVPVVLELDVAWRPMGSLFHLGVRRSPLRAADEIVSLARRAAATEGLIFHGIMAYEAQIAGVPDAGPAVHAMKAASRSDVIKARATVARALAQAGLPPPLFNGGGTGSLVACAAEASLTEVTAGSALLGSHLFDRVRGLSLRPAAFFALAVVRRPAPHLVTCHGGGYIASGGGGRDRLPLPALPAGLRLRALEGAGEVQTPLELRGVTENASRLGGAQGPDVVLRLGDPVFFRHAKAGELAEHFTEYLLVRGERVEARAPTYRGLGQCFLG
jgi:D-serine deaminase-like pyridoxal phosphate-dependent protein